MCGAWRAPSRLRRADCRGAVHGLGWVRAWCACQGAFRVLRPQVDLGSLASREQRMAFFINIYNALVRSCQASVEWAHGRGWLGGVSAWAS